MKTIKKNKAILIPLASCILFFILFKLVFHLDLLLVQGESMSPVYKKGQLVLIQETKNVDIGDTIVFAMTKKDPFIIKGLSAIYKDSYFVEGENKSVSEDSWTYGLVPNKWVVGKVIYPHSTTHSSIIFRRKDFNEALRRRDIQLNKTSGEK